MDILTFLAEVIKAAAWPVVVLGLVAVLRKPLLDLIPSLQRFKYKDFAVEFGKRLDEVAKDVAEALPRAAAPKALQPPKPERHKIVGASPRATILEAWLEVERAAVNTSRQLSLALKGVPARSPSQALRAVIESERLPRGMVSLVERMRALRNEAVHYPDFVLAPEAADEYAITALDLAIAIEELGRSAS
jgi:hypothetical protein